MVRGQSKDVISNNLEWLLHSGIRIKEGDDKGALYGWKYLNPPSYPFVYSETTGYAISCFSWVCAELGRAEALKAAKEAAQWIIKKMDSQFLVVAGYRRQDGFVEKGDISNQIYLFDNGMAMIGLLNYYKLGGKEDILKFATNMADSLIKYFFKGSEMSAAVLDKYYKPLEVKKKWSTAAGAHHAKLSLGLLELSRLTGSDKYTKISNAVCDFAVAMQRPDGSIETGPTSEVTYLHPNLYACEGLIYSGVYQSNERYLKSGIQGIIWAVSQLNGKGGLPRDNSGTSPEQSDAMCQLLRLMLLCFPELVKTIDESSLMAMVDKLHARILEFTVSSNEDRGGVKYQIDLQTTCSWCTMFCIQALRLWQRWKDGQIRNNIKWIDYFV